MVEPGDFVEVIEYPGTKFSGVVSRVDKDFVVVSASNGSTDWHIVHVPVGDRQERQLPQVQEVDQE